MLEIAKKRICHSHEHHINITFCLPMVVAWWELTNCDDILTFQMIIKDINIIRVFKSEITLNFWILEKWEILEGRDGKYRGRDISVLSS